jgi:cysteine desulfurase
MEQKPIYLDYNATTPVDPEVLNAMLPYFTEAYGNAASKSHAFGERAKDAVEQSRELIAKYIGAKAQEIVFTSGATESDNLAIMGVAGMYHEKGKHIITMATEHKAVLDTCIALERQGFEITYLLPDEQGLLDLKQLEGAIREDTILVSIMLANNETGVLQPVAEIGKLCRERGVLFHSDATQGVGKIPVDVNDLNVDLLSMSAHKIYGPKGVGALYVKKTSPRIRLSPTMHGGGHERGMRSGTLNVPGIVGMAKALQLCCEKMDEESARLTELRDYLEEQLLSQLDYVTVNGARNKRTPNCTNISFAYVEGEGMMMGFPHIAVSSGSACTSANLSPSHVLSAMKVPDTIIHSSLRFSMGRFTTREEIENTAKCVVDTVKKLREMSPLYEMVQEGIDLSTVEWSGH